MASNSEYVVNINKDTKDIFVTLTNEYVINFGKNNLLNTGACLDSFALFRGLNCDGDHVRAYIEAGKKLGINTDGVDVLDIIQMVKKSNIELHAKTKNFIDDGSMRGAFVKYAQTVFDLSLDFWIEKNILKNGYIRANKLKFYILVFRYKFLPAKNLYLITSIKNTRNKMGRYFYTCF